jgi:hypothetical protein
MIFKKIHAIQGNHVFANGTKALFNADGLYETSKQAEIDQLMAEPELYAVVEEKLQVKAAPANHDKLAKAITGLKTSDKM